MKIGLIDLDGRNHINLPLSKISAYHKQKGDSVEWYEPLLSGHMDKVYASKVFSFSPDYDYFIDADEIVKGGSGFCIKEKNGKETFDKRLNRELPEEIEHTYPDYELYGIKNKAYGFLTRGCPRGCDFCHVGAKEGDRSYKVADLSEFWRGQKEIILFDPNFLACADWKELLGQLIDSKAWIDFTQGLDIRLMTEEKAEMISKLKIKTLHFAWDNYKDKKIILPKLREFKKQIESRSRWDNRKMIVYVLTNFNSTIEEDLERVYTLREEGYDPYVMIYRKNKLEKGSELRKLQRWVNNRIIWKSVKYFEEYNRVEEKE